MLILAPVLLSAAMSGHAVSAYPVDPCSLRTLCDKADLIVLARVSRVQWNEGKAKLVPQAVFKGTLQAAEPIVNFENGVICPAPPVYEENQTAFVFLDWDSEHSRYWTTCWSYGLVQVDEADRGTYTKAIETCLSIEASALEPEKKEESLLEWFVWLIEHDVTRWDGVCELAPASSLWQATPDESVLQRLAQLSASQIQRLQATLYAKENLVADENVGLVRILRELGDPELPPFLLRYLKAIDEQSDADVYLSLDKLMHVAASMLGNAKAVTLAKDYLRASRLECLIVGKPGEQAQLRQRLRDELAQFLQLIERGTSDD